MFWDPYGTTVLQWPPASNLDGYYIGNSRQGTAYARGLATQDVRHALGLRLWRESRHDGVYVPSPAPLQATVGRGGRCIGTQTNLQAEWLSGEHFDLNVSIGVEL